MQSPYASRPFAVLFESVEIEECSRLKSGGELENIRMDARPSPVSR
ncbi:hypothetical protein [Streptomyces albogriseolus]